MTTRPVLRSTAMTDHVAEAVIDRGGIGEHADPKPVQALRRDQSFGAKQHGIRRGQAGREAVHSGKTAAA